MRKIDKIVIHCAATPNGKVFTVNHIDAMHKSRGFFRNKAARAAFNPSIASVGYHFVIEIDGTVKTGRGLEEVGAHVGGHNQNSIGVCMIGTDKFSKHQWSSLAKLVGELSIKYPGALVLGHRDLSPDKNKDGKITSVDWVKICPGFSVKDWLESGMTAQNESTIYLS